MADDRAARIDRLQRIQKIQAAQASQNQFARPAEDVSQFDPANVAISGLQHGMKVLDLQGGGVRSLEAKLMGVERPGEGLAMALNPLNKDMAPNHDELLRRAGMPERMQFSDKIPGYAEPGKGGMFQPEKGGALDPGIDRSTLGLGLDIATDPLTYESGGESAAARVLGAQAERAALRGNLNRTMADRLRDLMIAGTGKSSGKEILDQGALRTLADSVKNTSAIAARPISNGMEYVGGRMYRAGMRPLDQASLDAGKPMLSPLLRERGVYGTAGGIQQDMLDRSQVLKGKVGNVMEAADAANPLHAPPGPARFIDRPEYTVPGTPAKPDIVVPPRVEDAGFAQSVPGTAGTRPAIIPAPTFEHPGYTIPGDPGVPDVRIGGRREEIPAGFSYGQPRPKGGIDMSRTQGYARAENAKLDDVFPHQELQKNLTNSIEGIEGLGRVSGQKAVQNKTALYDMLPNSTYDISVKTPAGARVRSQQARGIKEAIEAHAEKIGRGGEVAGLNDEWGRYLTAQDAAERMSGRAAKTRLIDNGDIVGSGMVGGAAGGGAASAYVGVKKANQVARSTPFLTGAGYGMNRGVDAQLFGGGARDALTAIGVPGLSQGMRGGPRYSTLLDAAARQGLFLDEARLSSPWSLLRQQQEEQNR